MTAWQRYRNFILASLLVLASLVVLGLSTDRSRELSFPEKILIEIVAPLQKGVMSAVNWVGGLGRKYILLVDTAEENNRLREELSGLKQKMVLYQESHLANRRLRRILEFKERSPMALAAAEVVAFDPSGWFRTIIIDKGSSDGVTPGMAVTTNVGVVGRTVEVGYNHSKVLLMIDRASAIDALIQRTRSRGIVKGSPDGSCTLDYVIRNDDVQVGDMIVTSGLASSFPKGMVIGKVSGVEVSAHGRGMFQEILVSPMVDFDRLEEVLIVLRPNPFLGGVSDAQAD